MGKGISESYENLQWFPSPCPLSRNSTACLMHHFKTVKSEISDAHEKLTEHRIIDTGEIAAFEAVIKENNRDTIDFVAHKVGINSSSV